MFKNLCNKWEKLGIMGQILLAAFLAVITAYLYPEFGITIKPLGDLVLRLIKMIIVPLIFFSIAKAVIDIKDAAKAAKLGILTFLLYSFTTILATIWAVLITVPLLDKINVPSLESLQQSNVDQIISNASGYGGFWDAIFRIVPSNLLESFVSGETLSVIFFAVVVGFLILKMTNTESQKTEGALLEKFVSAASTLIYKFINVVVAMMPLAVYAYLTWMISVQDSSLIMALMSMIGVGYFVLIVHMVLTYGTLLGIMKLNFIVFLKKFVPVQLFAFSTASSAATIPLNERRLNERMGVSKMTSGFVIPFGATVNMDGTAICQIVYALFIAKIYGVSLSTGAYVALAVMSSVISIGVASVPSASLVTLGVVLGVVGIPIEGIGIIIATDRILDMARTTVNVTGDGVVAVVMDKIMGRFDQRAFYSHKVPSIES